MKLVLLLVMSAAWVFLGWMFGKAHERQKAWRRGLYEHSQLHKDDDNPPGSL